MTRMPECRRKCSSLLPGRGLVSSLHNDAVRGVLRARVRALRGDAARRLGTMSVSQMMHHVNVVLEMCMGTRDWRAAASADCKSAVEVAERMLSDKFHPSDGALDKRFTASSCRRPDTHGPRPRSRPARQISAPGSAAREPRVLCPWRRCCSRQSARDC
jgi:hypothetical protein